MQGVPGNTTALAVVPKTSDNRKLWDRKKGENGWASSVSQITCPSDCAFRNNGCYAEYGFQALTTNRLNIAGEGKTPLEAALEEAFLVDQHEVKYNGRGHVVGDSATPETALIVGSAYHRYMQRGKEMGLKLKVWTYTHAWRTVPRWVWRSTSVLASCERFSDVKRAMKRGYAAALVVPEHPADGKAYELDGIKIIPCPEQSRGATCFSCRLCWDDQKLLERKAVIAFAAHCTGKAKVLDALGRANAHEH